MPTVPNKREDTDKKAEEEEKDAEDEAEEESERNKDEDNNEEENPPPPARICVDETKGENSSKDLNNKTKEDPPGAQYMPTNRARWKEGKDARKMSATTTISSSSQSNDTAPNPTTTTTTNSSTVNSEDTPGAISVHTKEKKGSKQPKRGLRHNPRRPQRGSSGSNENEEVKIDVNHNDNDNAMEEEIVLQPDDSVMGTNVSIDRAIHEEETLVPGNVLDTSIPSLHATLVVEEAHETSVQAVVATPAPPDGTFVLRQDLEHIVRTRIAETRRTGIGRWYIAMGILLLAILVIAAVIGSAVLFTGGDGQSNNNPTATISNTGLTNDTAKEPDTKTPVTISSEAPTNFPTCSPTSFPSVSTQPTRNQLPVAQCKTELIIIPPSQSFCSLDYIDPMQLDNGSFNPEGGTLLFSILPPGPYTVGIHTLSLTVKDQRGGTDSCTAAILVSGKRTEWFFFRNHAYSLQQCELDWSTAKILAETTTYCGSKAHLATITSPQEQEFVRNLQYETIWIGGFQPVGALEPRGNWTWVNGEGQVYDGYTDWDEGEPNSASEDCMIILPEERGYHWDDRDCSSQYQSLQEVDMVVDSNVIVDGCDTGVPDRFDDVASCTMLINPGIVDTCGSRQTNDDFDSCIETFLTPLLDEGEISQLEFEKIMFCGVNNTPPLAVCQDVVVIADTSGCTAQIMVNASAFNNHSMDADGDTLYFESSSIGPYSLGYHEVTLTVYDGRGASDICQAILTVVDNGFLSTPWVKLGNSAYRLRLCALDWNAAAVASASTTTKCGLQAHLATIESQDENRRLQSLFGTTTISHWIGGFKPLNSGEPSANWIWDNDEGPITNGYTNWRYGEPTEGENCLMFSSDGRWYDENCRSERFYVEEIDLDNGTTTTATTCDLITSTTSLQVATPWIPFENHLYRFQMHRADWNSANSFANISSRCGVYGHLATITSAEEQAFVRSFGIGEIWLGGFQPQGSTEPNGNWVWVNNEGQIFSGYTNWDRNEPNNGGDEGCLYMHKEGRDFKWDDRPCSDPSWFLEEIDLERPTVKINGCDSGIRDILQDAETCSYVLADGLANCVDDNSTETFPCVNEVLLNATANSLISASDKEAIVACFNTTINAESSSNINRTA